MPPGQKGTGKKGRDIRQSRSRNTTPLPGALSTDAEFGMTALLELPISSFKTSEDIADHYGAAIPSSKDLELLLERLTRMTDVVETRSEVCNKGIRLIAQARKERAEEIEAEKRETERKERIKKEAADDEERGRKQATKVKKKKEERPLTHGAHGLAPQDGSNLERPSSQDGPQKGDRRLSDNDSASSSLSPPASPTDAMEEGIKEAPDDDSSSDEHQPKPAPAIPHLQTFGEDPSTFPDPTVYEIRDVTPTMADDQKREIYSVSTFPKSNLEDLIAGDPPDKDFSNAKPTNQVQANTFATFLEPFFRPLTEEDLAFLRERGDRTTPFIVPRRGKKHYTEIWAEEDGAMAVDAPSQNRDKLPANQARGSIDQLDDSAAESDQISAGPLLSRLLSTMRPEHRAPPSDDKPANGQSNGDANGNGELNGDNSDLTAILADTPSTLPPATYIADSNSEAWKKATHHKLDHAQVDERIKQELRHIGFLPPDTEPDYDAHYDDEISARLRTLQAKLKEQSIINGTRKARLMDLAKERMAYQEYSTILEDLDGQVNQAYLRRTRNTKNKKPKRPLAVPASATSSKSVAKDAIGDLARTVMERRSKWIGSIGGVFDNEFKVPRVDSLTGNNTSIFKPDIMAEFARKEKEAWDEEGEEE